MANVKIDSLINQFLDESNCPNLKEDIEYTQPCRDFAEWLLSKGLLKIE